MHGCGRVLPRPHVASMRGVQAAVKCEGGVRHRAASSVGGGGAKRIPIAEPEPCSLVCADAAGEAGFLAFTPKKPHAKFPLQYESEPHNPTGFKVRQNARPYLTFVKKTIIRQQDVVAELLVRGVDETVIRAPKERAGAHGRSAEAEHREILAAALARPRR